MKRSGPEPTSVAAFRSAANSLIMEQAARRSIMVGNFAKIGRLLLTVAFALLGGLIGRAFARRNEPRTAA